MASAYFQQMMAVLAAAGAGGVAPADYVVTNAAQLESAAAVATSGKIIEVGANITAPVTGTLLTFNPGITFRWAGNYTVAGYGIKCDANGNYTLTTFQSGGSFDFTGVNASSAKMGAVELTRGKFLWRSNARGINGGTTSSRLGNTINAIATSALRCELDVEDCEIYNSGVDLISGWAGYGSSSVAEGSYVRTRRCVIRKPGTGGSDNGLTVHDGFSGRDEGSLMSETGGGPLVNSAPAGSPMELFGTTIDMAGATSTNNDLHVTKAIGVLVLNAPATRRLYLHGDVQNPTVPSRAIDVYGISVVTGADNTVPALIGFCEALTSDSIIGNAPTLATLIGGVSFKNKINGRKINDYGSLHCVGPWESYNDELDVPADATIAGFLVRCVNPSSGSTASIVVGAILNGSQRALCNYATRSDGGSHSLTIKDTQAKAALAIGFGTFTPTNSTFNGTAPAGVTPGHAGTCTELSGKSWWAGLTAYRAAQPAPGTYGWSIDIVAAMGV